MKAESILKRKLHICLALSLLLVTGCSKAEQTALEPVDEIVLLEPVSARTNVEAASRRDLFEAKVYSGFVIPYMKEYSFEESVSFSGFAAFPGEAVSSGSILAYSNTEYLNEQITLKEEEIQSMEEAFSDYLKETEEKLRESRYEEQRLKDIVEAYERVEPQKYLPAGNVSSGDVDIPGDELSEILNPEYKEWYAQYNPYNGQYRILAHSNDTLALQIEQRTQLYELDHAYKERQLRDMGVRKGELQLTADMKGTVIATNMVSLRHGQWLLKDTPVIAVGDEEQKLIKCDYIRKSLLADAEEVYAMVNGEQYAVHFQDMDSQEYLQLSEAGEDIYSTFILEDASKVSFGDFAVIAVVSNSREQVLTVPSDAVNRGDNEKYVYVDRDGARVYTTVRTGMEDGIYTEILSGLQEGDLVYTEREPKTGNKTETLSEGSFANTVETRGELYYPSTALVTNPVENGRVYFQEYQVARYQHVNKGEVIATVRVEGDPVTLERLETKLKRLTERLRDLQQAGEKDNKKAITAKQKEISELEEKIRELKEEYETNRILAPASGILIWTQDLKKEQLLKEEQEIAEIASEDACYILVRDENHRLQYGNSVHIQYTNASGEEKHTTGVGATISRLGLSKALQTEYVMIQIRREDIQDMAAPVADEGSGAFRGYWQNPYRFEITAEVRQMQNVVLVPKKAVTESGGVTYVTLAQEDGTFKMVRFIAGGSNDNYYWCIEGLAEGMKVCLE